MSTNPTPVTKAPAASAASPATWRSFRQELDGLFDRFDSGFRLPLMRGFADFEPFWKGKPFEFKSPAVDVNEDEKTYKITAELPGIDEKNIEISLSGDSLVLKGEKRQEKEESHKDSHVSERCYGAFQRVFALPNGVDRDKIAANFEKGVLTITLPKTPASLKQQRKIEIKAA